MNKINLASFNNDWYQPGSKVKIILWYFVNALFLKNSWCPFSAIKVFFLRLFGAKIGRNVLFKPGVSVKYPWKLKVGNNVWIGENVWIDNLDKVIIEDNVCLSQGAMLLCGNHNYKKSSFDLIIGEITLKEGVWIGAKAIVCGGVTCESHAVLSVSSVASKNLKAYTIYRGSPAKEVGKRTITE